MVKHRKNVKSKSKRTRGSHVKASLTYVAAHRHTGRKLSHKHTSHGFLFILLVVVGIIMFFSLAALDAAGITQEGEVNVTLTVPGAPPTEGAVITQPVNNTKFKESLIDVSGTCPVDTVVAIYRNGQPTSSTTCIAPGTFQTTVQLLLGMNTLQAQNYDALDQPGPTTPQITVLYEPDTTPNPPEANQSGDISIDPSIPEIEVPQPSESPCIEPKPPANSDQLILIVPCIIRNVFVGERFNIPIYILGGTPPYALSVDWADGSKAELYSFDKGGRHVISHTYQSPSGESSGTILSQTVSTPNIKSIHFKVVDSTGASYELSTIIGLNADGSGALTGSNPFETAINNAAAIWLEASVPVYWAAVALFAGFWVGDLFQRFFGTKKSRRSHA